MKRALTVIMMVALAFTMVSSSAKAEGLTPYGKGLITGGLITGGVWAGKAAYDKYGAPESPQVPPVVAPAPVASAEDAFSRIIGKFVDNFWLIILTVGALFAFRSRKTVWCWLNKPAPAVTPAPTAPVGP